jgi:hypothetical protein
MKKRLFFVGSYHVFMGVDTYKKQLIDNLNKTEILGIEYYDSVTKTYRYYHINIQNLNPNQEVVSLNEYPDVYIYEIREELPQEMEIYSIEDFLPKKKSKKLKDSISYSIVYGFFNEKPFQRLTLLSTLYMDPNYMRLHPYLGALATQDECLNFLPNVDSLNLRLKTFNKWGASGAPVFFKVRNKKKERFEFAGVQCAGNPYFDCSIIVKAREVINLLNRVSRN